MITYSDLEYYQPLESFLSIVKKKIKFKNHIIYKDYKNRGLSLILETEKSVLFPFNALNFMAKKPLIKNITKKETKTFFETNKKAKIATLNYNSMLYSEEFFRFIV